jgi:hypothetical protein
MVPCVHVHSWPLSTEMWEGEVLAVKLYTLNKLYVVRIIARYVLDSNIYFVSCTGPGPHAVQRGPHLSHGEHEEGAREATLGSLEALQGKLNYILLLKVIYTSSEMVYMYSY